MTSRSVLLALCCLVVAFLCVSHAEKTEKVVGKKVAKKTDPQDNKGLTPFFLQDPRDNACLGPQGFTQCDENALWILTKRVGKKTYSLVSFLAPSKAVCLQRERRFFGLLGSARLVLGSCSTGNAKAWEWDFVDQSHVKLSTQGQCLVRGREGLKSSISLQRCAENATMLTYHPTAVHENGFYLKAPDGMCFDGARFVECGAARLLWGVGVKYVWGEAQRYFFNFAPTERSNCIVAKSRGAVEKSACTNTGALQWGLTNGQLSHAYGAQCVGRKNDDSAALVPCKQGFEFISLEVPSLYTNEQLMGMLGNQKLSQEDKKLIMDAIERKSSLSA